MITKRSRIMQGIMRHLAVRSRAETAERDKSEGEGRHLGHDARAYDEERIEQGNILWPIGNDQRLAVSGEIVRDRPRRVEATQPR
jgi:hypothetical protein